ncbi:MAG: phage head-tail connector protein [Proteobacteria bacterium]|nr:phage head-tail connector protein [Pseudomonadota bacterium]
MLTTATLVKSQLGISGSTYDTIIASIVTGVDAYIKAKTGVTVGDTAVVTITEEIADATGTLTIRVKYKPIVSLTKIEYLESDGVTWSEYDDETIGNVDFDDEGNEIFTRYVVRAKGKRKLRISYTAGYISSGGSANVPDDLEQCATSLACAIFNRRGNEGVQSNSIEGLSQAFEDITVADPLVRMVLTQYSDIYAI